MAKPKKGRPSKYSNIKLDQVEKLAKRGASVGYISKVFGISRATFHAYKASGFFDNIDIGNLGKDKSFYVGKSEKEKAAINRRNKIKYKENPQYRIETIFRASLNYHLRNKTEKTFMWLGYSVSDLLRHLENKFTKGMNWRNYGSYWEIDHIVPASWFNYGTYEDEDFKQCWGLHNLQPKVAYENRRKNNRFADNKGQYV